MDDRLYKFARLVEIGSFTRAASDLHISQPALTIAIQKLEQELGSPLLVRTGKKLELTAEGRAAYQASLDHQDIANHLRASLGRIAKKRPSVTVGMTDSIASKLCEGPAFEELENQADVTIIVNNSRYLRQEVERRRLDLAFTIDDGVERDTLQTSQFGTEALLLVCRPDVEQQIRHELEQHVLHNFISYDKPSTTYRHVHNYFSQIGLHTHTSLYSTSPDVMLGMVLRGRGTAALPEALVSPLIGAGKLAAISDSIDRPIALIRLPSRQLPPYLQAFVAGSEGLFQ